MPRRPIYIILNRSEISTLGHFMRKMSIEGNFWARRRAQAIYFSHQMKTVEEIARQLRCSVQSVYLWLRRYKQYGIKGLYDPERKKKLTDKHLNELIKISGWIGVLNKGKSKQYQNRWSFQKMADWIKEKWGITLTAERLRQIVRKRISD